jgi:molybdate/tungstate transport system permease protein
MSKARGIRAAVSMNFLPVPGDRPAPRGGSWFLTILWLPGVLLFLFILLPLARMTLAQTPAGLAAVAARAGVRSAIGLSLATALVTTLIAAFLGIPTAYLLSRPVFPGKQVLEAVVDLPLAVPHTVAGIALLFVFGRKGIVGFLAARYLGVSFWGTAAGIVVGMLFVSLPYMVNAARAGFEGVDPRLAKAARTLGATPATVFTRVLWPLALRNVASGMLLTYARSISEFGAVVLLAYYPMTAPVKIYQLYLESGLREASAAAVLLLAATLLTFILMRWLIGRNRWS